MVVENVIEDNRAEKNDVDYCYFHIDRLVS